MTPTPAIAERTQERRLPRCWWCGSVRLRIYSTRRDADGDGRTQFYVCRACHRRGKIVWF